MPSCWCPVWPSLEAAALFPAVRIVASSKGEATVGTSSLHHEETAQYTEWEEADAHHDAARGEVVPQDAGLHEARKNQEVKYNIDHRGRTAGTWKQRPHHCRTVCLSITVKVKSESRNWPNVSRNTD